MENSLPLYTQQGAKVPILPFSFSMAFPDVNRTWILHSLFVGPVFLLLFFFYRGCWGSEGIFSFEGSFEDTKAVLDFVLNDTQYNFDKNHIFFIGHSLGCVNAARMIALCSQAKGGVFLAPCDLWRIYLLGLENDDYREHLNDLLEEGIPYIHGTDEKTLTSEIKGSAGRLSISSCLQAISE